MKAQHLALMLTLSGLPTLAFAQRTVRTELKPSTSATATHTATTNPSLSEHKAGNSVHNSSRAARFQQVAEAVNLSGRQQKNVAGLIQSARQQLRAANANTSLTAEQRQQTVQGINLDLSQKFVGLLTPQQKADLTALLLKRKQHDSNANSSSANSAASPSAPDIPSVDAPSDSGSNDSGTPTSSAAASSSDSAQASASAQAAGNGTSSVAPGSVSAANNDLTASAGSAAPVVPKADPPSSAAAVTKPARLSDAQLAAILNSFVQDESADSGARPGA